METTTRLATVATIFVGIDVSKATLDVALRPSGTTRGGGIARGRRDVLAPDESMQDAPTVASQLHRPT